MRFSLATGARWSIVTAAAVGAHLAYANATLITATSQQRRELRLIVAADTVTTATSSAVLCSHPGGDVQEAKLWMPDMGHGSAPTQLVRLDAECTRIDHMDFLMAGTWDLRVRYADGDVATVSLVVQE